LAIVDGGGPVNLVLLGRAVTESSLREHILQVERRLLDSAVRKSNSELEQLLADDFVEFASVGSAYGKREVIDALQREPSQQRTISEFEIVSLSESVVLATYRLTRHGKAGAPSVHSLRSSIWRRNLGKWQMVFHQGTPCPVAPA
jgi:hypothetical protein